jgi:predicted DNA-binding ribbon-helix-helix protein
VQENLVFRVRSELTRVPGLSPAATGSLEDEFWNGLKEIAGKRAIHLSDLVGEIDKRRKHTNLSSALRLFVLDYYQRLRKKR